MKIACSSNCLTCSSLAACLTCPPGNALVSSTCTPCSAGTYPLSSSSASCAGGYLCSFYSFTNECVACSSGCVSCTSSSVCLSCSGNYYMSAQLCTACPSGKYALTGTSSSCTGCNYLHLVILAYNYIACSSNCASCTGSSTCLTCSSGYALISSACTACSVGTYPLTSSSSSCSGRMPTSAITILSTF